MKNPLRTAIRYAATAAAIAVTATGAMAQSYNATTAGGPTFNRPVACNALSGVGTAVRFHVQPVWAASAGLRTFTSVATTPAGWDNFLILYGAAWTPASPLTGCLALNDDGPAGIGQSQFTFNMLANTQYFIVTTGFANTDAGAFTNTVTGGQVTFGLINQNVIPEPSTYALMATGLVGLAGMARRRRNTQV
jgi:hypothetical protein